MSVLRNVVPESSKDAFIRDSIAGASTGVYTGIIGTFMLYVARKDLHSSEFLLGLICAAPFIGATLTLFYAHAMDGRPKMPFMIWPNVIGRSLFIATAFVNSAVPFSLLATTSQMLGGLSGPCYAAIMKEVYPDRKRGTLMAIIRVGATIMIFISQLFGGKLMHALGYTKLFPIAALFGITGILVFGTVKTAPVDPNDPANQRAPIGEFLKDTLNIMVHDKENRLFLTAISIGAVGNLIVLPAYTICQVDKLHITESQIAIIGAISTCFWALSYPLWGRIVDRRSPLTAWAISTLLYAALPISYFFATAWWHIIIGQAIAGASLGGMELGFFNGIIHFTREGKEMHHQALHSFAQGVRGVALPFCGAGLVALCSRTRIDLNYIFLLSAVFLAAGCFMLLAQDRRAQKDLARSTVANESSE